MDDLWVMVRRYLPLEIDEQTGLVIHPEADPENNVDAYFGKKLFGGDQVNRRSVYFI